MTGGDAFHVVSSKARMRSAVHRAAGYCIRQCIRLAKLSFLLALIALPVPIAAMVVALVRPRRNLPAQVLRKE